MKKMYIAVLDEAPDYMVPTLVAHTVISAHVHWTAPYRDRKGEDVIYQDWFTTSYRKVVIRVTRKEFDKIHTTLPNYAGHENTICDAKASCLVVLPVESDAVPNVLKFAKLWKPKEVL